MVSQPTVSAAIIYVIFFGVYANQSRIYGQGDIITVAIRKETIGAQIKRIQRITKNRDAATGMLFNNRRQLSTRRKKITLIGIFVSDEDTFLIRPHLFESNTPRNAGEWNAWLQENYNAKHDPTSTRLPILTNILDGMENRTGKQWRLYRIIGWLPDDSKRLVRSKTRTKRNKTKPQRRKNGRNRTRRR